MKKKSTRRTATAAEQKRWEAAVREESTPEAMAANKAEGRRIMAERKKTTAAARAALLRLAELKEKQGLSFADLSAATGIERGNLSRLFTHPTPNVNTDTLVKIATALNATLRMEVEAV